MFMKGHICGSAPLQFPMPTRPIQTYDTSSEANMLDDSPQNQFRDQYYEHATPIFTRESTHGERDDAIDDDNLLRIVVECLEEADEKTQELLKKIIAKLDKENSSGGRFIREILEDPRVRNASDLFEKLSRKVVNLDGGLMVNAPRTKQKGVKESTRQELLHKLERFKIKTVDLGGIVKDDRKK